MIIIIKDGYDVIDNRPEAEIAQSERDYFEERYNRDFNKLVRTRIRSLKDEIYKLEDRLIICNM